MQRSVETSLDGGQDIRPRFLAAQASPCDRKNDFDSNGPVICC
ncbi:hypothetical protein EV13_0467 [Prochlorococcus sp. MIT 0702]|nr:hypothetical protein EV12_1670 [Prochlorococcus sp. MIT 0701]KGG30136.1 hypothetical protein EV13_0467 [Prochlorococcus sp. MIT 0702]KGG33208.1 hypothetical protein EV14_1679 [Prochlorococcus sp. MIT 0703]